jgi:hypothetical protein
MELTPARKRFDKWLGRSQKAFDAGRWSHAASLAQITARSAWFFHPQLFCSEALERMLGSISAQIPGPANHVPGPRRVLHVLTQALGIGGHTRLIWRWIDSDHGTEHHVVLTQQDRLNAEQLRRAAVATGGQLHRLPKADLLHRAAALREMGRQFETIICHTHPNDVIPLLAWGGVDDHPSIAHLNHADHVFWLGLSIADAVINLRQSGRRISTLRRGVRDDRNLLLPLPLVNTTVARPRDPSRAALGIGTDEQILISIAHASKYEPFGDIDFAAFHAHLLDEFPKLRFIIVGPPATSPYWQNWNVQTNGRITAVGPQKDISNYLGAADLYLDSIPFASLTSLLEAVLSGLPAVAWNPHPAGALANVMSYDDPGTDQLPVSFRDQDAYFARIRELLSSPTVAAHHAETTRNAVLDAHTGPTWLSNLQAVYANLAYSAEHRVKFDNYIVPQTNDVLDELLSRNVQVPHEAAAEAFLSYWQRLGYVIGDGATMRTILKTALPARFRSSINR